MDTSHSNRHFNDLYKFKLNLTLRRANSMFLTVRTNSGLFARRGRFTVTIGVRLVTINRFGSVITLRQPTERRPVAHRRTTGQVTKGRPSFRATPNVRQPYGQRRHHRHFTMVTRSRLANTTAANPSQYTVHRPANGAALTQHQILITRPTPNFRPRTTTRFASSVTIHHTRRRIRRRTPHLVLHQRRHRRFRRFDRKGPYHQLRQQRTRRPLQHLTQLPVHTPVHDVGTRPHKLGVRPAKFSRHLVTQGLTTDHTTVGFFLQLTTAYVDKFVDTNISRPHMSGRLPRATRQHLRVH